MTQVGRMNVETYSEDAESEGDSDGDVNSKENDWCSGSTNVFHAARCSLLIIIIIINYENSPPAPSIYFDEKERQRRKWRQVNFRNKNDFFQKNFQQIYRSSETV